MAKNLAKKIDVRFFCLRLGRLKTLELKNHFVREVGCFLRAGHIYLVTFFKLLNTSQVIDIFFMPLSHEIFELVTAVCMLHH